MKNTINLNYQTLQARIAQAMQQQQRTHAHIQLLAVSKKQPSTAIRQAHALGLNAFAENYLQEALDKQQQLVDLALEWHFIGAIQSNKTQQISTHFSWVHTLARTKIATRLSAQRPTQLAPLNCCIQYNIDHDPNKEGVHNDAELLALAQHITSLPQLKLRGLMCIPENNLAQTHIAFACLHEKFLWLQSMLKNHSLDTLSMGMSSDLEIAIAHGSTLLRVGSALFGTRSN